MTETAIEKQPSEPFVPMLEVFSPNWKILVCADGSIDLPDGMTPSEALLMTAVFLSGQEPTPGNPIAERLFINGPGRYSPTGRRRPGEWRTK